MYNRYVCTVGRARRIGEMSYLGPEVVGNPLFLVNLYASSPWTEPGCSPANRSAILGDWRDPLDPDVDAQTIFCQFAQGREALVSNFLSPKHARSQSASSRVVSPTGVPSAQKGAVPMETNSSSQTGCDNSPLHVQASQSSSHETNGQFTRVSDPLVQGGVASARPTSTNRDSPKFPERTRSMGTMMGRSDSSIRTAHVFEKEIEEVCCQETCTVLLDVIDRVASSHRELEEYH